ncbi:HAMP domain-containing sensor histidine kinase [Nocardioides sp. LHD-245]|uniref:sensor histidine kinase n=1 Tax=Nocardioides sp. LHD-245 TaxID=3051387 RepID=UPI0027DFA648|nr:HAMP domain-containing sensor histidine kinase [Nocardioides sp. LHD-245]
MGVDTALSRTLQLIAEGVREFAGFDLAAVSLVGDGLLHTVAVVGDDEAIARLVDLRAPVELVERELEPAEAWGDLRFLPAGRSGGHLDGHDWVPDLVALDVPDAWHPDDLLCGLLRDDDGLLRGLLSVDLPRSGRRPDAAQRETLQMYVRLAERALVTALERGDLEVRVEREHAVAEYRRSIIDVLSHELRGTAAAIGNTVEVLRRRTGIDPATRSALDAVDGGANRITSVVDDMSALAKLGRPGVALRVAPTDLGPIVRDVIAFHEAAARLREVTVTLEVSGDLVVRGDPEDLDRMVTNLLSNAVKYTDPGGEVHVRVAGPTGPDDPSGPPVVVLEVADTGIGIAAADSDHVFEEFFRSRDGAVRRRPGVGLGLAIVERIVALHDGSVRVASTLGEGSTFTVKLPARDLSADSGAAGREAG